MYSDAFINYVQSVRITLCDFSSTEFFSVNPSDRRQFKIILSGLQVRAIVRCATRENREDRGDANTPLHSSGS
jgi:hypothetical protein